MNVTVEAGEPRCDYCGRLGWTRAIDGRLAHKHDCPYRTDDWCQAHPKGGCAAVDRLVAK